MGKVIASLNIVSNLFIALGIFILLISIALLWNQFKNKDYYSSSSMFSWLGIAVSFIWVFNLIQCKLHPSIALTTITNKPIVLSIASFILCGLTCMVVTNIIYRLMMNHKLQKANN